MPVYEWDEHNIGHIARHNVTPQEVERAMLDPRRLPTRAYSTPTQRRLAMMGETDRGRLLFVVYTYRGQGRDQSIRVVSARDANRDERPAYYR